MTDPWLDGYEAAAGGERRHGSAACRQWCLCVRCRQRAQGMADYYRDLERVPPQLEPECCR